MCVFLDCGMADILSIFPWLSVKLDVFNPHSLKKTASGSNNLVRLKYLNHQSDFGFSYKIENLKT